MNRADPVLGSGTGQRDFKFSEVQRHAGDQILNCLLFLYAWTVIMFSRSVMSNSFVTPWTVANQLPRFMKFPRQEYWSGLSFPPPGDLPNPEIEPTSLASPALAGRFFTTAPPGKPGCSFSLCDKPITNKKTVFLTSLSCSSKWIKLEDRVVRTLLFIAGGSEAQVTTWTCDWQWVCLKIL